MDDCKTIRKFPIQLSITRDRLCLMTRILCYAKADICVQSSSHNSVIQPGSVKKI